MTSVVAGDPATNVSTALLVAAVPFGAAIALLLISPLLAAKVKAVIHGQIEAEAVSHSVPEAKMPPHLTRVDIDAYIEYAADAVQIFPFALLPVTGAVFAIAVRVPSAVALGYLCVAVVAAIASEAWVLSQLASKYVTRGLFGYSVSTVVGIMSNLLGLAMILIYGP